VLGSYRAYQILDALEELNEHLPGLALCQLLLHHNPVEQLSLRRKLEHQVHAIGLIERILETQHVRVAHSHQYRDLLLQAVNLAPLSRTSPLFEFLYCKAHSRAPLGGKVYRSEVALAKLTLYDVLLVERTSILIPRVAEDESRLVENRQLIAVM